MVFQLKYLNIVNAKEFPLFDHLESLQQQAINISNNHGVIKKITED